MAIGTHAHGQSTLSDHRLLEAIRIAHTIIWIMVELALGKLLIDGFRHNRDRWTAAAAATVTVESVAYLANGARCPLTSLAEGLGAPRGSITDTYLPPWLAQSLPAIHIPVIALVIWLHVPQNRRST